MMISTSSFFSDTLNTVDAVIGNFVSLAYEHFIQANAEVITLLFTFYIMLLGYRFLNHDHHFNMSHIMRHLMVMLIVYGMVMSWHLYNLFVYNIFTVEPGNIAKILVNATGTAQAGTSISQAMDAMYQAIIDATMGLFGQASLSGAGIAFVIYGGLVFVIGNVVCVLALLLFIYAKMMMAVVLAIGPIFILFFLWDSTKGMFGAWLRQLITLALIPIVTSAILVLMLSVIHVTLPSISQPAESMQFYGLAPFLGLSLATAMILAQVLGICSALGGGITLRSLSSGMDIAKNSLQAASTTAAGAASVGRRMLGGSPKKMGNRNNRFSRNTSS
jgi:type IV secretion system protein VirB6